MNQRFNCHRGTRKLLALPLTERVLSLLLYWRWPIACSVSVAPTTVLTTTGSGDDVSRSSRNPSGSWLRFKSPPCPPSSLPLVTPLNRTEISSQSSLLCPRTVRHLLFPLPIRLFLHGKCLFTGGSLVPQTHICRLSSTNSPLFTHFSHADTRGLRASLNVQVVMTTMSAALAATIRV